MFDKIIRFALNYRLLVITVAGLMLVYGFQVMRSLPVDVFPDLNRPTVTIISEAEGLAPEEVETLVTFPIEAAMNGASGVVRVRSSSSIGFSIVYVEFDWDMEIYLARQIVAEKLNQVAGSLPEDVQSIMGPVSSIMGEVMFIGITSENPDINSLDLRTIAEWDVKQRLLGISGVSKITAIGGDLKQYHVLVDPQKMLNHNVTLHQVREALENANVNTTGGFLLESYKEHSIRNLGRIQSLDDLEKTVIAKEVSPDKPALTLADIAEVKLAGPISKRGDASINGKPGVLLAVSKQPGTDTIGLTKSIEQELASIEKTLPKGIVLNPEIFKQADFIENAIHNIIEALRDGSILVAIILFLFLLNFRTTAITLVAIPLSVVVALIIFKWFGMSINTMTLGGLAVAIGELVDDAIVDVENSFRRLRENRKKGSPLSSTQVIFNASKEVRNSIIFSTIIVIMVFMPLFAMSGLEGRVFLPLGVSYITAIIASMIVSLTVTTALCSYLLPTMKRMADEKDGWLIRQLKTGHAKILNLALPRPKTVFILVGVMFLGALMLVPTFGREFLPEFNEGSFTINVTLPPGTSLEESNRLGILAENLMHNIPEVAHTGRRTGRAEEDEHALGVNSTELEVTLKPSERHKEEIVADIRDKLGSIPGVIINIGQPISHRIDFITSGIRAQIAIKIFGDDLTILRAKAAEVQNLVKDIEGIADLQMEQQLLIPQIHVNFDRDKARQHGVMIGKAAQHAELAMQGQTVTNIIDGNRLFDVMLRLNDEARDDKEAIGKIPFETLRGNIVPLQLVADIEEAKGPNLINRESVNRRMVVQANTQGRDVVSVVEDIQNVLDKELELAPGYYISYGGQFESQASAQRNILILSIFSLLGMFLALYTHFRSISLTLQVMLAIPLSFIGAVIGIYLTGGVFSIATMVGFITLTGIASRNGIMMISHYLHLMKYENEGFDLTMLKRGTQERLVPVLMTALTALLALTPLVLASGETGKEILSPVATVIFSGLFSSTLLNLIVTPLVFWKFGEKASLSYLDQKEKSHV
ncbi:efflux RND transporter permease subunit [Tunicatimonas pelagia]|uniref:efflux RND transporter permease subunit n=1 Tax=Tunicatimonas pelagia TaxID=931531 RepID=UPI0026661542|nr:efflux RND transporter permease subunit [Tunicatimonas pelagia]WKN45400.1 efflux RND transporter permease subunit [Tunicatimonas pelagia]